MNQLCCASSTMLWISIAWNHRKLIITTIFVHLSRANGCQVWMNIYIYGLLPYADFLFLLLIIIIIWAVTAERQGNRCDSRRCHWSVFSNSMPRVRLKEWHTTVIEIISIWTPIGTVQWSSKNFIHFFHILCFI